MSIIISVLDEAVYSNTLVAADEVRPIHYPGPGDVANETGDRRASFVVPLRHLFTDFTVRRDSNRGVALKGLLYV